MRFEFHRAKSAPARPRGLLAFVLWALFGNADDGYYGDEKWRAGRTRSFWLAVAWWFRNPAHNLCFYVIGYADRDHWFAGEKDWGVDYGWSVHYCFLPDGSRTRPLVSYKTKAGRLRYIGWRPYGAFGIAFRK